MSYGQVSGTAARRQRASGADDIISKARQNRGDVGVQVRGARRDEGGCWAFTGPDVHSHRVTGLAATRLVSRA